MQLVEDWYYTACLQTDPWVLRAHNNVEVTDLTVIALLFR